MKRKKVFELIQEQSKYSSITMGHQVYLWLISIIIFSLLLFIPISTYISTFIFLLIIIFEKSSRLIFFNCSYALFISWICSVTRLISTFIVNIVMIRARRSLSGDAIIIATEFADKIGQVFFIVNIILITYLIITLYFAFLNRRFKISFIEDLSERFLTALGKI